MDTYLIWSLVLFAVGAMIAVMEVILPSAGILAIAALGALVGSLFCAYQLGPWAAASLAAVEAVVVPAAIVVAFKLLPRTRVGKRLILSPPKPGASVAPSASAGPHYESLLSQEGIVMTPLRPSGTVEIGGRRYSVVTNGEMIEPGGKVRVAQVEGSRIVVEAV